MRSPGSPGPSTAAPAMPRETLTAVPRRGAGRRSARGGAVREHRLGRTALRPDPRNEERQHRRDRPDRRQLIGRGGADDEPDRAAWTPARRQPRDALVEPLAPVALASFARPRSWTSPAPGFDVRHSTYANRSARSMSGAIASDPRYGLTVTASASSASNSATACRAAVEPMSPRLASAMTGTSLGIDARSRSSAAIPADPYASKKARLGLTAAALGRAASSRSAANRSTPAKSRENPSGRPAGSGSRPRQSTVPVRALRAARRSR